MFGQQGELLGFLIGLVITCNDELVKVTAKLPRSICEGIVIADYEGDVDV